MWKTVKLCDVCTIKTGKKDVNEGNSDGAYPFFTCAKEHTYSDVYSFDCEAILIAGNGAVGQTTYFKGKFEAYQRTYVLSDFQAVLPKLLLFMLQGRLMQHLSSMVLGNTIPYIKKGMLSDFEFSLPPLAEQQRIVAKLDAAFAEIDRAIEYNQIISQRLKQVIEVTLDEISGLGGVEVQLGNVVSINSSLVNPTREPYSSCLHIGAGNLMSMSNEIINVISAQEENLTSGKYPFDESTVLYSKIRPYLRKVHTPDFTGICSADMYPLTPSPISLQRSFLFYLLLSQKFTSYAVDGSARAGMPKVNQNHLFAYRFLLPSLSEQDAFSRRMDVVMEHTKSAASIYGQRYSAFTSLKSAILAQELYSHRKVRQHERS